MSDESQRASGLNAAANSSVHHAELSDIAKYTPEKVGHLRRGGIRSGTGRSEAQMQQMLEKIPPSQRAGNDGQSAAAKVKEYLADKDASHIQPHSKGGSAHPDNIKWESKAPNRSRGDQPMTPKEQSRLDMKNHVDNLSGALKSGLEASAKGAIVGAVTTAPFAMLRNGLRVIRGEISSEKAALETVKETAIGGAVGAVTAFTVTAVASACPPIAIALTAISPALLVAGGAGMVWEFFKILEDHKKEVKQYYKSLTENELQYLQGIENELIYEHSKNLEFLDENKLLNTEISSRSVEPGIEGALQRYLESLEIAKSLGAIPVDNQKSLNSQKSVSSAS